MSDTTLDTEGIDWNDDGSITLRLAGSKPHRFRSIDLDGYAESVNDSIDFAEWLATLKAQYDEERTKILALLPDSDDDDATSPVTPEFSAASAAFNSQKRRDDLEMKRRLSGMTVAILQRSDPEWEPPERTPSWFGTLTLPSRILDHWESIPFLGRANGRGGPSIQTPATKSSSEPPNPEAS